MLYFSYQVRKHNSCDYTRKWISSKKYRGIFTCVADLKNWISVIRLKSVNNSLYLFFYDNFFYLNVYLLLKHIPVCCTSDHGCFEHPLALPLPVVWMYQLLEPPFEPSRTCTYRQYGMLFRFVHFLKCTILAQCLVIEMVKWYTVLLQKFCRATPLQPWQEVFYICNYMTLQLELPLLTIQSWWRHWTEILLARPL